MKWKNVDIGPAYYYITGTVTEWLPLLNRQEIRELVCNDINHATREHKASIGAFVIMPDHIHMLVFLPEENLLHKFNKCWRGRSGRHIPVLLQKQQDLESLQILSLHANGGCKYATWKEQVRALAIWDRKKLYEKVTYIHNNPVRRNLVDHPEDWNHSSWKYYENAEPCELDIVDLLI